MKSIDAMANFKLTKESIVVLGVDKHFFQFLLQLFTT